MYDNINTLVISKISTVRLIFDKTIYINFYTLFSFYHDYSLIKWDLLREFIDVASKQYYDLIVLQSVWRYNSPKAICWKSLWSIRFISVTEMLQCE